MSGSNNEIDNPGGPASSAEPSMEEILASIRRILKDDQPAAPDGADADEDVFVLDSSMVVKPGPGISSPDEAPAAQLYGEPEPLGEASALPPELVDPTFEDELQSHSYSTPEPEAEDLPNVQHPSAGYYAADAAPIAHNAKEEENMSDDRQENYQGPEGLVSDSTSEAAAGSIGALIRSISSDRQIAVGRVGLTLEDLVREELRPLLKAWLDTNLPALVERIVRAEIQRVVERSNV